MAISCLESDIEKMMIENSDRLHQKGFLQLLEKTERRFVLPTGKIMDILSWEISEPDYLAAVIVELKREALTINAVAQIAEYYHDFCESVYSSFDKIFVKCVLCGETCTREVLNLAVLGLDIDIYTYSFDFNGLSFQRHWNCSAKELECETEKKQNELSIRLRQAYNLNNENTD